MRLVGIVLAVLLLLAGCVKLPSVETAPPEAGRESTPSAPAEPVPELPEPTVVAATEAYDYVDITHLADSRVGQMGSLSKRAFATYEPAIVDFIHTSIASAKLTDKVTEADLNNNHTEWIFIKLSGVQDGFGCTLYYDTLYDSAYLARAGDFYTVGTDFARYILSFLREKDITLEIEDGEAVALFADYGWTLDYQISAMQMPLDDLNHLSGFSPNAYYFAYNNVFSKDIGLDLSGYANTEEVDVAIYRIHEPMPWDGPKVGCRGIVLRSGERIIGAFINAGRQGTAVACSLNGKRFEDIAGQSLWAWLAERVTADSVDERLAKLTPEELLETYFAALADSDIVAAQACFAKHELLGGLTRNMSNSELFLDQIQEEFSDGGPDNLKSTELLAYELEREFSARDEEPERRMRTYWVSVDLQFHQEVSLMSGINTLWYTLVYESPQTGWKIVSSGTSP